MMLEEEYKIAKETLAEVIDCHDSKQLKKMKYALQRIKQETESLEECRQISIAAIDELLATHAVRARWFKNKAH